jgi:hypothetical protein
MDDFLPDSLTCVKYIKKNEMGIRRLSFSSLIYYITHSFFFKPASEYPQEKKVQGKMNRPHTNNYHIKNKDK